MTVAIFCTALLGLLVFGLGFGVSLQRGRTGTNFGFTPDPGDPVYHWVRAHGNATEYCPMLAVLILFLGSRDPATWVLAVAAIATASRYAHAAGILFGATLERPHPLRFAGALGTYVCGFLLVAATLLQA